MEENNQSNNDPISKESTNSLTSTALIILVLLIVGFFGYKMFAGTPGSIASPESTATSPTTQVSVSQEAVSPTVSTAGVTTIDMEAGSFYYKPNIINAKLGDKIKIVMRSVSMMHDFNIDELGVKLPVVKNGDTGEVEFVASKKGKFEFYCSVGQHRKNGQVGTITIE